jgi:hypothetical protein
VPWGKDKVGLPDLNRRVLIPYLLVLGWGAVRTLQISALAIALCFPLGLVGGLMRLSDNRLARGIASVYVETVRNVPLLGPRPAPLWHSDQRPDWKRRVGAPLGRPVPALFIDAYPKADR